MKTTDIYDDVRAHWLNDIIADLYAKLGKLQTLAVSNNNRLNTTADPSHPNAYTPFTT